MEVVLLTTLGVGGATVIGALLGLLIKHPSHKVNDMILAFAAGVMLAAAVVGLLLPSLEHGQVQYGSGGRALPLVITIVGLFVGALALSLADRLVPHLHRLIGADIEAHPEKTAAMSRVLLFVLAIAIHNLPEGLAVGVGFGTGDTGTAITVALGIALQNIPEGMVIIAPMTAAGISRRRTFLIAFGTGLVEVVGAFIGYFAVRLSALIFPFALAFAGGTMLYVISDEMILETHAHGAEKVATYSLLVGFAVMLVFDFLLG